MTELPRQMKKLINRPEAVVDEALEGAAAGVRLSGGPLVEGAVIGAVEASIGRSVDEVLASTEAARDLPKVHQR